MCSIVAAPVAAAPVAAAPVVVNKQRPWTPAPPVSDSIQWRSRKGENMTERGES